MARRRSRRGKDSSGFAWMLLGLGLGLIVAAGVYFSGWRVPAEPSDPPNAVAAGEPAPRAAENAAAARTEGRTQSEQPSSASRAAPAAEAERRFDFYEILPQYEVVVPEVETVTRSDSSSSSNQAAPTVVAAPGTYVLQTGSFRSHSDADRMQASLALLGIESRIQKVTIDTDVFHRVRVGPISDLEQLNRLRAQLRGAGVDTLMMKVNNE